MGSGRRGSWPILAVAALAVVAAALLATPAADARGFIQFGFGVPLAPAYYPPPVVYGPPAYYAPPYYASPPVAYAPQPQASYALPPATAGEGECREYRSTVMIGGIPRQSYGTACLQPDGTWRIIN